MGSAGGVQPAHERTPLVLRAPAAILLGMLTTWLLSPGPALGAEAGTTLEIMASDISWLDAEYFGHAFLCVAPPPERGEEKCLGFYPKDKRKGVAIVGGPGVIETELMKNPARFARVKAVFKTTITDAQLETIFGRPGSGTRRISRSRRTTALILSTASWPASA